MNVEMVAWIILRVVYAWMFLYPLKTLVQDWSGSKGLTELLLPNFLSKHIPFIIPFTTILMYICMLVGGFCILFGIFVRFSGFMLMVYCLLGAIVHYRLARKSQTISSLINLATGDKKKLDEIVHLAIVGNITSAEKNFVLAAVGCFFFLMG